MNVRGDRVESNSLKDFANVMKAGGVSPPGHPLMGLKSGASPATRINLDQNNVKNGLGRLVLTLVKLIHELLERQAISRIDAGYLSEAEVERLGVTLMMQAQEIDRLRREFLLTKKISISTSDLSESFCKDGVTWQFSVLHNTQSRARTWLTCSERILDKGIVIAGDIRIKSVDVELLTLQIRLVICSVDKAKEMGMDWWTNNSMFSSHPHQELSTDSLARIEERLTNIESRLPS